MGYGIKEWLGKLPHTLELEEYYRNISAADIGQVQITNHLDEFAIEGYNPTTNRLRLGAMRKSGYSHSPL